MYVKRHVYLLGGTGNVLFQLMKMKSLMDANGYSVCDFFINSSVRKVLGHTKHPNFYKQIVNVDAGGYLLLPVLFLDVLLYKILEISLFTVFDINAKKIKIKPVVFDWLYLGYFQDDVDVFSIYKSRDFIKNEKKEKIDFSLHVRGGDFSETDDKFTSPLDIEYYRKAYIVLSEYFGGVNLSDPVIITNDRKQSEEIVSELNIPLEFSLANSAAEDFLFLNNSKVMICSNSTFALMAALTSNVIEVLVVPSFFREKFNNFEVLPFKVIFI